MTKLDKWLQKCSTLWFVIYATSAAFMTYFSMYAFRKTFAVGSYSELDGWHYLLDFKTAIVLAQIIGYASSKFIGIKVIAEMTPGKRATSILLLVMVSELALVLFAVVPKEWKMVALFLNGLPLGMIWGLVFSFLEGRRVTEILGAGLSISFIVSSGVVKSVGKWLMLSWGVSEWWMPALTGLLFTLPLFVSVWLLAKVPPPNSADVAARNARFPMDHYARKRFLLRYFPGLALLIATYILLTGLRDFSDNYAAELWQSLGYGDESTIFAKAAVIVSLATLAILGLVVLVKNNFKALMINHGLIFFGILIIGVSTLLFEFHSINGEVWMIALSAGIYIAYIPFNCLLFDRLLAVVNDKANAGFLIYVADAMGYAGSVGILLYKSFFNVELSWLRFMINSSYIIALFGMALIMLSALYFRWRLSDKLPAAYGIVDK
ncbi:DUF5690 family protein [Alteromonas gilva]|uniref:DUF5690 family protein n=1 Tax=Alteromonas gilva TaxID=2987522 RepID=A0ABT5KX70_9ALTE|nr:DUF5690 family protein [Alteromonas gilva]MDC8829355.1 DUF5690 family protein [Alteromonas gilva]